MLKNRMVIFFVMAATAILTFVVLSIMMYLWFTQPMTGSRNGKDIPGIVKGMTAENSKIFENELYHHSVSLDENYYDGIFFAEPPLMFENSPVVSGVIPHDLAAGKYLVQFFNSIKNQRPPVVVLLGSNHTGAGNDNLVSSLYYWKTPDGFLQPNAPLIQKLADEKILAINEGLIGPESSIGAPVAFIAHFWHETKLVPIIVKENTPTTTLNRLAGALKAELPPGSLVLASIDFSHYQPYFVSNFHDILSENILATNDLGRVNKAEIDSQASLYFLLKYNSLKGADDFHLVAHSNSALIAGHSEWTETTSHILGYYTNQNHESSLRQGYGRQARIVNPEANYESATSTITLQFFGDIMLDRSVAKVIGKNGLDYLLGELAGEENRFFAGTDLFMANLEGAFAEKRVKTSKSIAFRFDPALAAQLKRYNFGAFTLSNNHSLDMGKNNFDFTEKTLAENGIDYCGKQYDEGPGYNLVLTDGLPESVAFVCFETLHAYDKKEIKAAIDGAKAAARYVIVQVHGGVEYRRISTTAQRDLYRWLIDQGASAVIGHHPHVVEEIEIYKGAPIVYSLGNFIFDQYFSKETQEGLSVGLVLSGGNATQLHLFPFYGVKSQVQLMTSTRRDGFLKWMEKNSRLEGKQVEQGVIQL